MTTKSPELETAEKRIADLEEELLRCNTGPGEAGVLYDLPVNGKTPLDGQGKPRQSVVSDLNKSLDKGFTRKPVGWTDAELAAKAKEAADLAAIEAGEKPAPKDDKDLKDLKQDQKPASSAPPHTGAKDEGEFYSVGTGGAYAPKKGDDAKKDDDKDAYS